MPKVPWLAITGLNLHCCLVAWSPLFFSRFLFFCLDYHFLQITLSLRILTLFQWGILYYIDSVLYLGLVFINYPRTSMVHGRCSWWSSAQRTHLGDLHLALACRPLRPSTSLPFTFISFFFWFHLSLSSLAIAFHYDRRRPRGGRAPLRAPAAGRWGPPLPSRRFRRSSAAWCRIRKSSAHLAAGVIQIFPLGLGTLATPKSWPCYRKLDQRSRSAAYASIETTFPAHPRIASPISWPLLS